MISLKKRLNVSAMLLLAVLIAVFAYQAGAERFVSPVQPARVATINLPVVMEGLAQRSSAEADLRQMREKLEAERQRREADINRQRTEYEQLRQQARTNPERAVEAERLAERLELARLQYQSWIQYSSEELDIEHAIMLMDLDRAIRRAAGEMADAAGYDLVLVENTDREIMVNPESRTPRSMQVEQQMLTRIVLHANRTIDITNDLIERMNNAYRAGAAAP